MSDDPPAAAEPLSDSPYAVLRERDFRRYLTGNCLSLLFLQMQSNAVGWEIYGRTDSSMALAYAALTEWVPVITLALIAGHVADRVSRRKIIITSLSVVAMASLGLAMLSTFLGPIPTKDANLAPARGRWAPTDPEILCFYACLLLSGMARAFMQPAKASFLPQLVPRPLFPRAITWNMVGFQLAMVLGPALGGFTIYLLGGTRFVYQMSAAASAIFVVQLLRISPRAVTRTAKAATLSELLSELLVGIKFVWRNKVILGAVTLDMFAVLLGGATALFPVFAKDILKVGAWGFGCLDAAPGVGALCMSFVLAHMPPMKRAGRTLLWSVVGFGMATIVFGISRSFELSLAMLFLVGATDMISVVIRHTLIQVLTPDAMRGRVSAVNAVFIGSSNQLGGFESAVVAALFHVKDDPARGATISVVAGGIGTMLVVAALAWLSPSLRRYGRLDGKGAEQEMIEEIEERE